MLTIGLTGGIASGKSTVARALDGCGAVVIDADVLAREVVEPGTAGLARVVARFGERVLDASGGLDRAALARIVFDDGDARRDLEAIIHPAVAEAFEDRLAAAPPDAIVVHDVPLLTENGLAPRYHLVVVTEADLQVRVRRAVTDRGMAPEEVLARAAAQATDAQRREVADIVLGTATDLAAVRSGVELLWRERLVPYRDNLLARRCAPRPAPVLRSGPEGSRGADDGWPQRGARVIARVRYALGAAFVTAEQVGPTAEGRGTAADVIEIALTATGNREQVTDRLASAGLPPVPGHPGRFANADPAIAVDLAVTLA